MWSVPEEFVQTHRTSSHPLRPATLWQGAPFSTELVREEVECILEQRPGAEGSDLDHLVGMRTTRCPETRTSFPHTFSPPNPPETESHSLPPAFFIIIILFPLT